jgi:hypothetical protein
MTETNIGRPGDLCILLVPGFEERAKLRQEQELLATFFNGWIVPEPHITCQRFRLAPGQRLGDVIQLLQAAYQKVSPFTLYAAGLTEYLAPFWGTYVLRWQVLEDHAWRQFIHSTDATLQGAGCQIYYAHDIPITCSAVDLTHKVRLDEVPDLKFPHSLFLARKIMITGILGSNDFETVGEVSLEGGKA